ncbi:MAG: PAS domain S-box protein [Nitrospirota bacterium]|jgi:PAS domain S-box-containing protein
MVIADRQDASFDSVLLRAMVTNAVDGIIAIDARGSMRMVNPAAERLFGYAASELIGQNVSMLMPEPYHSEHDEYLRRYVETGVRKIIGIGREVEGRRKDGATFPMYLSVAEVRDGEETFFAGIVHDLSEHKRAAQEMRRMRSYLKNIIDSMPSILVGVDIDGRVTEWNQEAENATGIVADDALGHAFVEVLPQLESQQETVHEAVRQRRSIHAERLAAEQGGEVRYSDVVVYPLIANGATGAVIRVDDVTNRVRIEQMMVQTEKMMSVGGLAAGMAHEINNPLSGILQGCQNLARRLSVDLPANQTVAAELGLDLDQVRRYLEQRGILEFLDGMQGAALRASGIVADMLAFSRRSTADFEPAQVDDMLDTVLRLADSDYDLKKKYDFRQIEVVRDYDHELPPVYCNRTEIEQVFLNVIKNAAQALASRTTSPSRITLRTRQDAEFAQVEIADDGPGIDEETCGRVFEPFFTTKPVGIGTGLGLSVSYFIVTERHHGTITVSSTPGRGTCFVIRLPLAGKAVP